MGNASVRLHVEALEERAVPSVTLLDPPLKVDVRAAVDSYHQSAEIVMNLSDSPELISSTFIPEDVPASLEAMRLQQVKIGDIRKQYSELFERFGLSEEAFESEFGIMRPTISYYCVGAGGQYLWTIETDGLEEGMMMRVSTSNGSVLMVDATKGGLGEVYFEAGDTITVTLLDVSGNTIINGYGHAIEPVTLHAENGDGTLDAIDKELEHFAPSTDGGNPYVDSGGGGDGGGGGGGGDGISGGGDDDSGGEEGGSVPESEFGPFVDDLTDLVPDDLDSGLGIDNLGLVSASAQDETSDVFAVSDEAWPAALSSDLTAAHGPVGNEAPTISEMAVPLDEPSPLSEERIAMSQNAGAVAAFDVLQKEQPADQEDIQPDAVQIRVEQSVAANGRVLQQWLAALPSIMMNMDAAAPPLSGNRKKIRRKKERPE